MSPLNLKSTFSQFLTFRNSEESVSTSLHSILDDQQSNQDNSLLEKLSQDGSERNFNRWESHYLGQILINLGLPWIRIKFKNNFTLRSKKKERMWYLKSTEFLSDWLEWQTRTSEHRIKLTNLFIMKLKYNVQYAGDIYVLQNMLYYRYIEICWLLTRRCFPVLCSLLRSNFTVFVICKHTFFSPQFPPPTLSLYKTVLNLVIYVFRSLCGNGLGNTVMTELETVL